MAQCSDLQPVDHRSAVSAGSCCLAERCAASDPNLHPGQLDGVAALELEAAGRLTVEVDRRSPVAGRPRSTRNHHTLTPEWDPWGSPPFNYPQVPFASNVTVRRSRLVGGGMALTGGCEDYGWKALASRTGLPGTKGRGHPVPVGAADSAAAGARLSRHPRGVSFQISRCG